MTSSSSAEEAFLRNREEREKARLTAGHSDAAAELENERRAAIRKEIENCTKNVESSLDAGNLDVTDKLLRELRRLIQDAAATATLTAYEMAKANTTVARFQELEQELRSKPQSGTSASVDQSSASVSEESGKMTNEKKRKFRFSAAALKRDTPTTTRGESLSTSQGASPQGSQVAGNAASYGPARGETMFIPNASALFISGCENCTIFCVPIAGSAFVSDCKSCRVYVACSQLRLKNCENVEVYAWVASVPIIELCTGMRFGPYTCWRGLVKGPVPYQSETVQFDSHRSCVECMAERGAATSAAEEGWRWVEDFQWLKKTPSPNWRLLDSSEYHFREEAFTRKSSE